MKSAKYITKFNLPPQEVLIDDWSCALSKSILLQGRMYMSQGYVCFRSNVFGKNIREAIRFEDIATIKKKNKFAIGIEILLKNDLGKYFFCSFISRSKTYKAIYAAWNARCGVTSSNGSSTTSSSPAPSSASSSSAGTLPRAGLASNSENSSESNPSSGSSGASSNPSNDNYRGDEAASAPQDDNGVTNMYSVFTPADTNGVAFLDPKQNRVEVFPATEIPLTPAEYFYLLLSDQAHEFELGIKYLTPRRNVEISKWGVNADFNGAVTREVNYIMSLVELKAPIGPPETRVADTNRYALTRDKCVYQIKSFSLDIPYGDCFHIEAEWTITLAPSGTSSFVSATACLAWTKRCLMKSIVEMTTLKQIRNQYQDFFKHACEYSAEKRGLLASVSFDRPANAGKKAGDGAGSSSAKKSHHHRHKSSHKGKDEDGEKRGEANSGDAVKLAGTAAAAAAAASQMAVARNGGQGKESWNYVMNGLLIVFALVLMYLSMRVSRIEKMIVVNMNK